MPPKDDLIREANVGDPTVNRKEMRTKTPTILERPIHKLVLILERGQGIRDKERTKNTTSISTALFDACILLSFRQCFMTSLA